LTSAAGTRPPITVLLRKGTTLLESMRPSAGWRLAHFHVSATLLLRARGLVITTAVAASGTASVRRSRRRSPARGNAARWRERPPPGCATARWAGDRLRRVHGAGRALALCKSRVLRGACSAWVGRHPATDTHYAGRPYPGVSRLSTSHWLTVCAQRSGASPEAGGQRHRWVGVSSPAAGRAA